MLWALSFHEFSHGFVAYKLGDPTAARAGRLTLDPLKHIDVFGFIALIVAHVGWAKPVPVNPNYFRNPRRDMLLVALAGPLSNFLSAVVGLLLLRFLLSLNINFMSLNTMLYGLIYINVAFGTFNLLPLPPLDGWRIVEFFWKDHPPLEHVLPFTIVLLILIFYVAPQIILWPINKIFWSLWHLFIGPA